MPGRGCRRGEVEGTMCSGSGSSDSSSVSAPPVVTVLFAALPKEGRRDRSALWC